MIVSKPNSVVMSILDVEAVDREGKPGDEERKVQVDKEDACRIREVMSNEEAESFVYDLDCQGDVWPEEELLEEEEELLEDNEELLDEEGLIDEEELLDEEEVLEDEELLDKELLDAEE